MKITTDGYVITAYHVIDTLAEGKGEGRIKTQSGSTHRIPKSNVWYNKKTDIAIVYAPKVTWRTRPEKIMIDQECDIKAGDQVRVLGIRDGQAYNTLGMVTGLRDMTVSSESGNILHDIFDTDVRGVQGQSGGIIVNKDGEVIGIPILRTIKRREKIGTITGAKISNALTYINSIAAKKSAKLFL